MNLVKEKLWSASNRRYVWDMHPEKDPSRVALGVLRVIQIELCTCRVIRNGMERCDCEREWEYNKQNNVPNPLLNSVNRVQAGVWPLSLLISLFVQNCLTNKQTNKQTLCGLGGMQAPHSWPFAIRTSHAENSRFYVKKKEKKAKHKNSNNCKVWVVFECGGRHNCFWCTSWEEMTMRLKCLLRRFI